MCEAKEIFIQQKAENFRQFLLGHNPDSVMIAQIDGFKKEALMGTLMTVLLPGLALRGSGAVADEILAHLKPVDVKAVKAKIERYFECFQQALLL